MRYRLLVLGDETSTRIMIRDNTGKLLVDLYLEQYNEAGDIDGDEVPSMGSIGGYSLTTIADSDGAVVTLVHPGDGDAFALLERRDLFDDVRNAALAAFDGAITSMRTTEFASAVEAEAAYARGEITFDTLFAVQRAFGVPPSIAGHPVVRVDIDTASYRALPSTAGHPIVRVDAPISADAVLADVQQHTRDTPRMPDARTVFDDSDDALSARDQREIDNDDGQVVDVEGLPSLPRLADEIAAHRAAMQAPGLTNTELYGKRRTPGAIRCTAYLHGTADRVECWCTLDVGHDGDHDFELPGDGPRPVGMRQTGSITVAGVTVPTFSGDTIEQQWARLVAADARCRIVGTGDDRTIVSTATTPFDGRYK